MKKTKPSSPQHLASTLVPLERILSTPLNPRKHFDADALQELASSIKAQGVLQPILLRVAPGFRLVPGRSGKANGFLWENLDRQVLGGFVTEESQGETTRPLELVAGERRFRAAKLAGLTQIPAIVRELTDRQAAEIRLIENVQRRDLDPMEEARGYQELLEQHGHTVDELAEKTGKSASWVRSLVKLVLLPPAAAEALTKGELSRSAAQLLARIPGEKARAEATDWALTPPTWADEDVLPSFRDLKAEIERRWMVELKGAPFSRQALDLVSRAGSCDACPKRTGNNKDEYPDARADVCTDPDCYRDKVAAHTARQAEQCQAKGIQAVPRAELKQLFSYGRVAHDSKFVDLRETCWHDPKRRTYEKLVGKDVTILSAIDPQDELHLVADKAQVHAALKKAGVKVRTTSPVRDNSPKQAQDEQARRELARRMLAAVADTIEGRAKQLLGGGPDWKRYLAALARKILENQWHDAIAFIAKRRGFEAPAQLEQAVGGMNVAELYGLIAEASAGRLAIEFKSAWHQIRAEEKAWLEQFGFKVDAELKAIRRELAEKKAVSQGRAEKKAVRKAGTRLVKKVVAHG